MVPNNNMRTATALTLVLLGGGATTMAVHTAKRCQDPSTGEPIACSSTSNSGSRRYTTAYGIGSIGNKGGGGSGMSSVSRGGFGSSGSASSAGS